jgi:hemolysin activation/secretion protein
MILKHGVPIVCHQMSYWLSYRIAAFNVAIALLGLGCAWIACAQAPGGDVAQPAFDILEFAVEGNSRLSDLQIERAVGPFLGEGKSVRDVEAARAALEAAYQDSGFLTVVVAIPEQEVAGGSVTLKVSEGEVDRLRVRGAEYHLSSGIKSRVPELAEGNVPYFPQVQRELEALNRNPALKATPVLKPGRAAGSVAVQLDVDDSLPLSANLELSNRQSANTTPQRLSGNLRYDNLFQLGHSAALTLQTSPQKVDEVRVAALTYVVPSGSSGDAIALYSVVSRSKLATLTGSPGLGLLGNTTIFGARYALSLRGITGYVHSLSLGIDYKDVKQSVVTTLTGDQITTPISYTPLVAAYNGTWLGAASTTSLDVNANVGVRGVFGNRDSEFAAKRIGAVANFLALRGGVRHNLSIARWNLSARLEGQLASGPLVTNEQFAAGGAESVRGYLESERVGDAALRYSIEVRTPRVPLPGGDAAPRLNLVGFVEGVSLRTLEAVLPTPSWRQLRGAGFGLRLAGVKGFSLDIDWAHAFADGDVTRAGNNRIHARLLWEL